MVKMNCPICDSEEIVTLKNKAISSKSKEINQLLLKCESCGHVFKESFSQKKPQTYRLIISENENSKKTTTDIYPDEKLSVGDILLSDYGQSEITSLELKNGKRVDSAIAEEVDTIWAYSIEIPSRIGISINYSGITQSYKVDLDRDFRIGVDDIIRIEDIIFKVRVIKTIKKRMLKGSAVASVIRRVYGDPVNYKYFDYNLTDKIASKKELEDKYKPKE
jgi:uncharacterized Zn finger protein